MPYLTFPDDTWMPIYVFRALMTRKWKQSWQQPLPLLFQMEATSPQRPVCLFFLKPYILSSLWEKKVERWQLKYQVYKVRDSSTLKVATGFNLSADQLWLSLSLSRLREAWGIVTFMRNTYRLKGYKQCFDSWLGSGWEGWMFRCNDLVLNGPLSPMLKACWEGTAGGMTYEVSSAFCLCHSAHLS